MTLAARLCVVQRRGWPDSVGFGRVGESVCITFPGAEWPDV